MGWNGEVSFLVTMYGHVSKTNTRIRKVRQEDVNGQKGLKEGNAREKDWLPKYQGYYDNYNNGC